MSKTVFPDRKMGKIRITKLFYFSFFKKEDKIRTWVENQIYFANG